MKHAVTSVCSHRLEFVLCGQTASESLRTRCWGRVRGQQREEWEFLFWESFHRWKQILLYALQIFSLLSALLSNPCSPDIRTPPLPFQSVSQTCALLNPCHHQEVVGVIICLTVICPLTLVVPAALRFKEHSHRAALSHSAETCVTTASGKEEARSWGEHFHSWTDSAHMSLWSLFSLFRPYPGFCFYKPAAFERHFLSWIFLQNTSGLNLFPCTSELR